MKLSLPIRVDATVRDLPFRVAVIPSGDAAVVSTRLGKVDVHSLALERGADMTVWGFDALAGDTITDLCLHDADDAMTVRLACYEALARAIHEIGADAHEGA